MTQSKTNYIFGPVPSRRLGRSLGVDLVPFKTCPYDCIYCQLGRTTNKTVERKEWAPLDVIVEQLQKRLERIETPPDYITLSGSGEPTLFSRMDELIDRIQSFTSTPIAVLTNSAMLWDRDVRRQILKADLIVPSLDAGDESLFRYVNRPHESLDFHRMLDGLIQLREEFSNTLWLEVFLLAGHSAIQSEIDKIVRYVEKVRPDRVQLNTVVRPPAEDFAYSVPQKTLHKIAKEFDPPAEVVAEYRKDDANENASASNSDILSILSRRPCTLTDLSHSTHAHPNELVKHLEILLQKQQIKTQNVDGNVYYSR